MTNVNDISLFLNCTNHDLLKKTDYNEDNRNIRGDDHE